MAWHRTWNPDAPGQGRGRGFFRPRMPWKFSGVTILVLITVAVFIVDYVTSPVIELPNDRIVRGQGPIQKIFALRVTNAWLLYPLISYQFLHGGFFHIFFNMLILWMLGRYLESGLGRKQFFYLYFISGIVGGLFQIGFNVLMARWANEPAYLQQPAVGASGAVMGVLMAFGTLYPRERLYVLVLFFFVPIEARWLAIGYFVIETVHAVQALTSGASTGVAHAAHVGGLVVGYIWIRFGRLIYGRLQGLKRRAVGTGAGPPQGRGREEAERAEVDRILKKIHQQGIASLTTREKLFLQEMSRRYRDQF